jgi:hypothetical protein
MAIVCPLAGALSLRQFLRENCIYWLEGGTVCGKGAIPGLIAMLGLSVFSLGFYFLRVRTSSGIDPSNRRDGTHP